MADRLINIKKLDMSAVYYKGRANTLSRYCNEVCSELREELSVKECPPHIACVHCKTLFHPNNHKVRFIPKHKVNERVLKLIDQPNITQRMKLHLIDNHKKNKTYPIYICKICKKTTKLEGFSKAPKKKAPVFKEPAPVLSRKEKKKLKKKAAKRRKLETEGIGFQSSLSISKVASPSLVSPKSSNAVKAAEVKQPHAKNNVSKTPRAQIHARMKEMLNKDKKKELSGLESFLSSL